MEISELNLIKITLIILVVILYWKFVYYRYHTKIYTPLSFIFGGGILSMLGFYNFFISKNVRIEDFLWIFLIISIYAVFSFISLLIAIKKHGLKIEVDITLTWLKRIFPFMPFWFWMIISIPIFFLITAETRLLLGKEHIIFWILVLFAWIKSNIRLYKKEIVE